MEVLDHALLRPGRFDVKVLMPTLELSGRKAILEHYLGKVKRGPDVDVDILARRTVGFTGAHLKTLVNQAALRAAIEGAEFVTRKHLEFARDKIAMGSERKTVIPDKRTNFITAIHESGHALVASYTKDAYPVDKVTIVPRGNSLGHTAFLSESEQYYTTRAQLRAMIDTAMGGRVAEELLFGTDGVTSGASLDLQRATILATAMVKHFGMSEKFGLRIVGNELSPATTDAANNDIERMLQGSYERAKKILLEHPRELLALVEALMKHETLDADAIKAVLAQAKTKESKNIAEQPQYQTLERRSSPPLLSISASLDSEKVITAVEKPQSLMHE